MKKLVITSIAVLALLSTNALAREYKCTDKDVIVAGVKVNLTRGVSFNQTMKSYHNFRPWQINNIEQRGFTPKTMIGCTADTKMGGAVYYVIHIDKETGKAYVHSSPARSYKMLKNGIKAGNVIEIK